MKSLIFIRFQTKEAIFCLLDSENIIKIEDLLRNLLHCLRVFINHLVNNYLLF